MSYLKQLRGHFLYIYLFLITTLASSLLNHHSAIRLGGVSTKSVISLEDVESFLHSTLVLAAEAH